MSDSGSNEQVTPSMSFSAPVSPRFGAKSYTPQGNVGLRREHLRDQIRSKMNSRESSVGPGNPRRTFHPDASLVLVGIRGCGKRSLGLIAATALGRRFIVEDHFFQSTTGLSRQDYLKVHGSEEFHKQDIEISKRMLEENKFKCVIDCGLGSLTGSLQDYLKQYSLTNPVVYLIRDMDEIKRMLNLGDRSARMLETGDPSHRKCSNFEFYNLEESSSKMQMEQDSEDRGSSTYSFKLKEAQADFSYFVRFIVGISTNNLAEDSPYSMDVPVDARMFTHALQVRTSDLEGLSHDLTKFESAGDVIEICVDRWSSAATKSLSKYVALVRRVLKLPIMLSAWRGSPGIGPEIYMTILRHGLRLGVEFLSVDLELDTKQISTIIAGAGPTKIVGSYIQTTSDNIGWKDPQWMARYARATTSGCDLVRLVRPALSRSDNETLAWFVQEIRDRPENRVPLIAYNTGHFGRTSQIMNPVLTPVTHPEIQMGRSSRPEPQEPQLSSREVLLALGQSFVLDPLHFYIVGANVSESLSPAMHNPAYQYLGLPHQYSTKDITSWEDIESLAQDDRFGGAAVVQPWKVKVVKQLAALSYHARTIGAVNTLMPLHADSHGSVASLEAQAGDRNRAGRVAAWYGDNTDFVGIMVCLSRSLSPRNVIQSKTSGLVIGAGGMARAAVYAMLQMGCKNVFVYNRTTANTQALVQHFNDWINSRNSTIPGAGVVEHVKALISTEEAWPADFAMPTMIVSCITHENLDGKPGAEFQMPVQWLQSPSGGAVVEMAYMRRETPLVKQIKQFRESTNLAWVVVDGIDTLIEQAVAQFEIMTGRKAPRRCMEEGIKTQLQAQRS